MVLNFILFSEVGGLSKKISSSIRLEDRLDGQESFRSWRSRLMIILEENDLLHYVKSIVVEPVEPTEKIAY